MTAGLGRRIAALALPALVVLAAEPLYLLFDTAVIGRLRARSAAQPGARHHLPPNRPPRGAGDGQGRAVEKIA